MAASVSYSQADGLTYSEDQKSTVPMYTLVAWVEGLDPGTDQSVIAQALSLVPPRYTDGSLFGISPPYGSGSTVLLSRSVRIDPRFPTSCYVDMHFGSPIAGTLLGPVKLDVGTTLQQAETSFDAANQALPWTMRTCIEVKYDVSTSGAPGANAQVDGGTVPFYAQYPTATFTVTLPIADYNVGALSTQYCGMTNVSTFMGEPPGNLLMMAIHGTSEDGEVTNVTQFALNRDAFDQWTPVLRYIDPVSGKPPKLSPSQLQHYNGINQIVVQGISEFNDLPIA